MTNVSSSYANGSTTWSHSGQLLRYGAFALLYPYLSHFALPLIENGLVRRRTLPKSITHEKSPIHFYVLCHGVVSIIHSHACLSYSFVCIHRPQTFVSDSVPYSFLSYTIQRSGPASTTFPFSMASYTHRISRRFLASSFLSHVLPPVSIHFFPSCRHFLSHREYI